jgi:hypothetical protein
MQDQGSGLQTSTRLFERAVIFVWTMALMLALLYVVGNYQGFTDRTQLQLLQAMQGVSGIGSVAAVVAFVLECILLVLRRRLVTVVHLVLLVFAAVAMFGLALGSTGILVFLEPVYAEKW